MNFIISGHNEKNTLIDIVQVFYQNEKFSQIDEPQAEGLCIKSQLKGDLINTTLFENGNIIAENHYVFHDGNIRKAVKLGLYELLSPYTGYKPSWGILTGIRPAKISTSLSEQGMKDCEIFDYMTKEYFVHEEKAKLSISVAKKEKEILDKSCENSFNLYLGIPFCPTRCLYCSFTAYPIDKYANSVESYADALIEELGFAKNFAKYKKLESLYIGGGTPTSINAQVLEKILKAITESFDFSYLREFCVEAGRPDTITDEKLDIMKNYGVSRISVNPQTMNDKTLSAIGRKHTVADFYNVYNLARKKGFNDINIDLILGLDGENCYDVENTFKKIAELSPEEVTVHILSVKRASRLKEELNKHTFANLKEMEEFLSISKKYMEKAKLKPYYMYRQKNMLGNFENVGYSKDGFEGVYNIQIMEERQDILALGAGATSKFVNNETGRIERAFNLKSVEDYIKRVDEMKLRKDYAINKVKGGTSYVDSKTKRNAGYLRDPKLPMALDGANDKRCLHKI